MKKTPAIQMKWNAPIVLATWEAEAESSFEHKSFEISLAILGRPIKAWVGRSVGT